MGKYIKENGKWFIISGNLKEEITDIETLRELKKITVDEISAKELWSIY